MNDERDMLIERIEFYVSMMDCRLLHMLLGFARGISKNIKKEICA